MATVAIYQQHPDGSMLRLGTARGRNGRTVSAVILRQHPDLDAATLRYKQRAYINGQWVDWGDFLRVDHA